MTSRRFIQNLIMVAALAIVWWGIPFANADNIELVQSALLKVMGVAIVLRTLVTIGDGGSSTEFYGFLILGAVTFGLGFVGDAFGLNDIIFPIVIPIATGFLGASQFSCNREIYRRCDLPGAIWVLGWAYPVVMILGAALAIILSWWTPFFIASIVETIGLVGALVYSFYVIKQFPPSERSSNRSSSHKPSESKKRESSNVSAGEKEVVNRVQRVARNFSKTVDLGYGAHVEYSVKVSVYFGHIEYTVSAKKSGTGISSEYELERALENLKRETERLVEDIMDSTERSLSEIVLPREYDMNVKVV